MIAYHRNMGGVAPTETAPVGNVANGEPSSRSSVQTAIRLPERAAAPEPISGRRHGRTRAALHARNSQSARGVPPGTSPCQRYEGRPEDTRDKKGEDAYSIQIIDMSQRIQGYLKSNVQVIYDKTSIMPAYDAKRLNESDLTDLVGYLTTLRGYELTVNR